MEGMFLRGSSLSVEDINMCLLSGESLSEQSKAHSLNAILCTNMSMVCQWFIEDVRVVFSQMYF